MSGLFCDLTTPRERVLIATDTLSYTLDGPENAPLGFSSKVLAVPHLRGALVGAGAYELLVRTHGELLMRPYLLTNSDVLRELPEILIELTEQLCEQRGMGDHRELVLFTAGWIGWNEVEKQFEMALFENVNNYKIKPVPAGLFALPNVSVEYAKGVAEIADPVVRAMAGLRSIHKFCADYGTLLGEGGAALGGEIQITTIDPAGVATRTVGKFDDMAQTRDAAADTWAEVAEGGYQGHGLVNRVADRPAAMQRLQEAMASGEKPGLTRQQRRHAEKMARKAGRAA